MGDDKSLNSPQGHKWPFQWGKAKIDDKQEFIWLSPHPTPPPDRPWKQQKHLPRLINFLSFTLQSYWISALKRTGEIYLIMLVCVSYLFRQERSCRGDWSSENGLEQREADRPETQPQSCRRTEFSGETPHGNLWHGQPPLEPQELLPLDSRTVFSSLVSFRLIREIVCPG